MSLLQNLLFYYDSEHSSKPIGVIFLEGCFCERVLNPSTAEKSTDQNKLSEKMVRTLSSTFISVVTSYCKIACSSYDNNVIEDIFDIKIQTRIKMANF